MIPNISICICTYNRSETLPSAIKSVLAQSYEDYELIIVDDCSDDDTAGVVSLFKENLTNLRYIRHSENKGLAAARNTAIREAHGRFFTFCDDDDIWDQNYLKEFVELAKFYDSSWCFCCGSRTEDGTVLSNLSLDGKLKDYIKKGYTPPVAGQFYFIDQLRAIDGYNERIRSGVDHDLWIRLSINNGNIKSLGRALAIPNQVYSPERMTTNENKRRQGIEESLGIWKEDLVKYFGVAFFNKFQKSYRVYMDKKFIFEYLKSRSYFKAIMVFIKSPVKLLFIRSILQKKLNKDKESPLLYIR